MYIQPLCNRVNVAGLIEHTAWTKGDAYLDNPIKDMPWHQQLMLDVFAIFSAIIAGMVCAVAAVPPNILLF